MHRSCCLQGEGGESLLAELLDQTLALPAHKKGRLASLACLVKSWDIDKGAAGNNYKKLAKKHRLLNGNFVTNSCNFCLFCPIKSTIFFQTYCGDCCQCCGVCDKVVARYPQIRSEALSLAAAECALAGPVLELYDNILAAEYNKHKVLSFKFFVVVVVALVS